MERLPTWILNSGNFSFFILLAGSQIVSQSRGFPFLIFSYSYSVRSKRHDLKYAHYAHWGLNPELEAECPRPRLVSFSIRPERCSMKDQDSIWYVVPSLYEQLHYHDPSTSFILIRHLSVSWDRSSPQEQTRPQHKEQCHYSMLSNPKKDPQEFSHDTAPTRAI